MSGDRDVDVFDDLEAEQDRLEQLLADLDVDDWAQPSQCDGWSVSDVVLHLAQTEEAVLRVLAGETSPLAVERSTDELMARWVEEERGDPPPEVLERWATARRHALERLRSLAPDVAVPWAVVPLRPKTLATTRLAEHWIHALDIADPLGIDLPDTDRLWHIARLAHRTLPFAFDVAGRGAAPETRFELRAPSGEQWALGPDEASTVVYGSAGTLCRVAGRRLDAARATDLVAEGPRADEVLELVRTYA